MQLIRKAKLKDAAGIARVHVDSWKTTYQGIVADSFLDSLTYEDRTARWTQILEKAETNPIPFVAEDPSGKIVGFAQAGPARELLPPYKGELYAIYILQSYQGKGIGKQLVQAVAQELQQKGIGSFYVWVLTENPFKDFYESIGGKQLGTKPLEIGGERLEMIAYGWEGGAALF